MSELDKTQWHPAFCVSMELGLKSNKEKLEFQSELNLNSKPIQLDLMVIEKESDLAIENVIGRIFRKYNIFEYKSPEDELGVDEYAKLLGYACLYKAASPKVDSRKFEDITVSLVRNGKPAKLIQWFTDKGCKVEEKYKGIYYISGDYTIFPTQIVVTSLLEGDDNIWLRALTNNLSIELGRKLVLATSKLTEKDDKEHADSLLQVTMERNIEIFREIKEDPVMCNALNDLMRPELDAAKNEGINEGANNAREEIARGLIIEGNYSDERIAQISKLSAERVRELRDEADFEALQELSRKNREENSEKI